MRYLFSILFVTLVTGCSGPQLILSKTAKVSNLGIALSFDQPNPYKTYFEENLDVFISEYNLKHRRLKLSRSVDSDSASLRINVLGTRLVTPQQQAVGAVVSLIGLSFPFLMVAAGSEFYIFFYYFPNVVSVADFSLSSDINGSITNPVQYRITSPGFLKKPDQQIEKHGPRFRKNLFRVMTQLENSKK